MAAVADYRALGQQTQADNQARGLAFAQWAQAQGVGDGTVEGVRNWVTGGGAMDAPKRFARLNQLNTQFGGIYDTEQLKAQAPQPTAQYDYHFTGDQSVPGLMERYAVDALGDWNNQPSALGDYWSQNQQRFAPPGEGDQHWNQVQGGLAAAGNIGNNAQDAYDQFNKSAPANTDPYYDYAVDRSSRELNSAMAGRGMGRSSWAVGQLADLNANLRGQQAQANAGYGLQRAGIMGQLAGSADASARANSQNQLSWLKGAQEYQYTPLMMGAQVAGQVDAQRLARDQTGAQIASMGQDALRGRTQDYFNNTFAMGNAAGQNAYNTGSQAIAADQNAFEAQHQGAIGANRENVTAGQNQAAQTNQGMGTMMQIYGMYNQPGQPQQPPRQGGGYQWPQANGGYDPRNGSTMRY